ncbi:MAG: FAD-linked oxidase C-terminal domain-containing protein [Halieaceae bacterium]|jgi:glycolate oxidase|nr:FAD-linked oxidase C-terminal domain-containing protein [Halieaceae bacterium]
METTALPRDKSSAPPRDAAAAGGRARAGGAPGTAVSAELLRELRAILPAHRVITDTPSLKTFESDALMLYRELPLVAVMPETIAQVQDVLRLAHRRGVPVVPRGAGTGLSAGALPHPEGILLNLAAMDRILAVDAANQLARVQPGVSNLSISAAAEPYGLFYAPDPSSQIICSIGGNVAENSGGVHCLKYGLTVHNLLAVKMVTIEGDLISLGGDGLSGPGPDLLALVTGSEGLLGVVVEVTVRLLPRPEATAVLLAGFASVRSAGDAVSALIGAGMLPAGLEMMDGLALRAAEDFAAAGYPRDAEAILLCELDGLACELDELSERASAVLRSHGATSVTHARDAAERDRLWKGRKCAFPAVGRIARDYYCMDGTIPRSRIADVLEEIARLASEYGLRVANVFHAGDGNLHPLILFDSADPDEVRRAEDLGAAILELSVAVGGCITGEHGVGLEKLRQMPAQFSESELMQFEELKAAFDENLLLNPGKGIPILRRCQEYRALPGQDG